MKSNLISESSKENSAIDFILNWAKRKGRWATILATRIIGNPSELSDEERREILSDLLDNKNTDSKPNNMDEITIGIQQVEDTKFSLISLSDINGVNKLSPNQSLEFSRNITVVYGDNGSGKTGYSRILKFLGNSYDGNKKVLPNVYDEPENQPQSATIHYQDLDIEEEVKYEWDGQPYVGLLNGICVFTNNCVHISLGENREFLVTPIGFHFFKLIGGELEKMTETLRIQEAEILIDLEWIKNIDKTSEIYLFLNNIENQPDYKKYEELSEFSEETKINLEKCKRDLKELNKPALDQEQNTRKMKLKELAKFYSKYKKIKSLFSSLKLEKFQTMKQSIGRHKKNQSDSLTQIIKEKNLDIIYSTEFEEFISSAEKYLKKFKDENYPSGEKDEQCLYCNQILSSTDSKELIKKYRTLVADNSKIELEKIKISFQKALDALKQEMHFHFNDDLTTQEIKDKKSDVDTMLREYLDFVEKEIAFDKTRLSEISKFVEIIIVGFKEENKEKRCCRFKLKNIDKDAERLSKEINKLELKKLAFEKREPVKKQIEKIEERRRINNGIQALTSRGLSQEATKAREVLISKKFQEQFNQELDSLKRNHIKLDMSFTTSRGTSKIRQNIEAYQLSEILSEGEQKTIALAEFIAELQFDQTDYPVILDDPVTSLDHKITDLVAKRLVRLSKERQVVVFTHNILFYYALLQCNEDTRRFKDIDFNFYCVEKDTKNTGILDREIKHEKNYTYLMRAINKITNNTPTNQKSEELATKGYGLLRSAIEKLIEEHLFGGVVYRYKKNIATTSLTRVSGASIDKHKSDILDVYDTCCKFVDGHSDPDGTSDSPDFDQLEIDYKKIEDIKKEL
jgi:wobble nucleotide-excising tRNase